VVWSKDNCLAAVDAFSTGNLEEMQQVIDTDREVDAYEVGIDEDCTLLIARRQPTARDLRLVMAISRIVTDLERIGDKAAKIASMSLKLHQSVAQRIPRLSDVQHCGRWPPTCCRARSTRWRAWISTRPAR
jgi:phosphate transport system protein